MAVVRNKAASAAKSATKKHTSATSRSGTPGKNKTPAPRSQPKTVSSSTRSGSVKSSSAGKTAAKDRAVAAKAEASRAARIDVKKKEAKARELKASAEKVVKAAVVPVSKDVHNLKTPPKAVPDSAPAAVSPVPKPAAPVASPVAVAAKSSTSKPSAPRSPETKAGNFNVKKQTVESSAPVSVVASRTEASRPADARPAPARVEIKSAAKPSVHRTGFKANEFIVYPAHGVGQIVAIEEQEVAGFKLELFVISFAKDKMTLKVPLPKVLNGAIRKLADGDTVKKALDTLTGRARVKRTMWSRRAQEYEAKINSGDLGSIAEVVRDLYRSKAQPEQSYSERQLYEAALDRMAREIAAVNRIIENEALKLIDGCLQKGPRRGGKADAATEAGLSGEIGEAA